MTNPAEPPLPPKRKCRECASLFYARRHDQVFCGSPCRSKHHERRKERGLELYDAAYAWRRNREKQMLSRLCEILDPWIREDKAREKATQ